MTNERAINVIKDIKNYYNDKSEYHEDGYIGFDKEDNEAIDLAIKALEQEVVLEKVRAEIKEKIEQEEFARSVFRHEEKDTVKAEQCTGSIMAYNNVIKIIDKYKAESEDAE